MSWWNTLTGMLCFLQVHRLLLYVRRERCVTLYQLAVWTHFIITWEVMSSSGNYGSENVGTLVLLSNIIVRRLAEAWWDILPCEALAENRGRGYAASMVIGACTVESKSWRRPIKQRQMTTISIILCEDGQEVLFLHWRLHHHTPWLTHWYLQNFLKSHIFSSTCLPKPPL